MKPIIKLIAGAALLATGAAHAHYLWLEPGDSGVKLYYGEAEALLKEKSPGKLDSIKAPKAFVPDAATGKPVAVAVRRNATHFAIASNNNAPAVVATEESLEVRDMTRNGLGFAKSNYYARQGRPGSNSDGDSPLALDVRGQGEGSNVLTAACGSEARSHRAQHLGAGTQNQRARQGRHQYAVARPVCRACAPCR